MQNNEMPVGQVITWTASESVARQRGKNWYWIATGVFVLVLLIVIGLFLFKVTDLATLIISMILASAMFIALIISTKLPSKQLTYVLSSEGLNINGQLHQLGDFRAFGVRRRGELWQLVLIPVKRFGMEIVAYIDETNGEKIVDMLASYLPMEEVPESGIDKLIDKLNI